MADPIRKNYETSAPRVITAPRALSIDIPTPTRDMNLSGTNSANSLPVETNDQLVRNNRSVRYLLSILRKSVRRTLSEARSRIELTDDNAGVAQNHMWIEVSKKFPV